MGIGGSKMKNGQILGEGNKTINLKHDMESHP